MLGLLLGIAFAALQGAAVFLTANIGLRLAKVSSLWARPLAMALACVGWIAITVGGYALLGGEGGLMDGFGFVLSLRFACIVSSLIYAVAWTVQGAFKKARSAF
jgi:hypothetical protein